MKVRRSKIVPLLKVHEFNKFPRRLKKHLKFTGVWDMIRIQNKAVFSNYSNNILPFLSAEQ